MSGAGAPGIFKTGNFPCSEPGGTIPQKTAEEVGEVLMCSDSISS